MRACFPWPRALLPALVLAALPRAAAAHGSEFVYARLVLDERPRLEISLEYTENPVIRSREEALAVLEHDLILHCGGSRSCLGELTPGPVWREACVFPPSAPVPVPSPAEGSGHRLLTAIIDLSQGFEGDLQLSVEPGSEQAVILWVEPGSGAKPQPLRWSILLGGDTSPGIPCGPAAKQPT